MDWDMLTKLVIFFEGFIWAVIIFFFLPELWRDMKEMWLVFRQKENSAEGTAESHRKIY